MKTVIWAIVAVILAAANFVVEVGTSGPGGHASVKVSMGAGYALAPFIIAGLFALAQRFRNWTSFFKIAAIIGLLALLGALGKVKPPPG